MPHPGVAHGARGGRWAVRGPNVALLLPDPGRDPTTPRVRAGLAAEWGLTFVSSPGNVVEYVEPCSSVKPCLRVVVPRREIPKPPRDLAWLDEDRLAVLVGGRFRLTARWRSSRTAGSSRIRARAARYVTTCGRSPGAS